jgi:mannose/fructose/N-acetylgalactosamine-specific phosphotransferase system component IIC
VDYLPLTLLGGLLALDGTAMGQFMVSRPLVAGVLAGWVVGDPVLGLLIGGIMEVYFISIFPVGGSEFPEGGPPALVAVATGVAVAGPAGVAMGVAVGLLLSRLGALSTRIFRRLNGRIVADPSRMNVTTSRIIWAHLACLGLDFVRGCLLSVLGLWVGSWIAAAPLGIWPLRWPGTLALLAIGATIPAGALVGSLGGWRKRGKLFGAGLVGFLLAFLVLG